MTNQFIKDKNYFVIGRKHLADTSFKVKNIKLDQITNLRSYPNIYGLVNTMPGLVFCKNIHSEYVGCNQKMLELYGVHSHKKIIGKDDSAVPWRIGQEIGVIKEEDRKVLSGKVSFVLSKTPFNNKILLIKKIPLFNNKTSIIGIINYAMPFNKKDSKNIIQSLSYLLDINLTPELINNVRDFILEEDRIFLTSREEQCLQLASQGLSSKEIAKILNLSFRTIESYFETIKRKFKCKKMPSLISKAISLGYI